MLWYTTETHVHKFDLSKASLNLKICTKLVTLKGHRKWIDTEDFIYGQIAARESCLQ